MFIFIEAGQPKPDTKSITEPDIVKTEVDIANTGNTQTIPKTIRKTENQSPTLPDHGQENFQDTLAKNSECKDIVLKMKNYKDISNFADRVRQQKVNYEQRTPNRFHCNLCSFETKRHSHLVRHEAYHKTKGCKIHQCNQCDFKTIRLATLTK